jgi:hypothetical protein
MRFQIDLDSQGECLVEELERRTGVKTHRELFNNALTLLDWATEQAILGRTIAALDSQAKQSRELVMPVLKYAAGLGNAERASSAAAGAAANAAAGR